MVENINQNERSEIENNVDSEFNKLGKIGDSNLWERKEDLNSINLAEDIDNEIKKTSLDFNNDTENLSTYEIDSNHKVMIHTIDDYQNMNGGEYMDILGELNNITGDGPNCSIYMISLDGKNIGIIGKTPNTYDEINTNGKKNSDQIFRLIKENYKDGNFDIQSIISKMQNVRLTSDCKSLDDIENGDSKEKINLLFQKRLEGDKDYHHQEKNFKLEGLEDTRSEDDKKEDAILNGDLDIETKKLNLISQMKKLVQKGLKEKDAASLVIYKFVKDDINDNVNFLVSKRGYEKQDALSKAKSRIVSDYGKSAETIADGSATINEESFKSVFIGVETAVKYFESLDTLIDEINKEYKLN